LRLILAGGGGAKDSRALDERFAAWIAGGRLLYLPIALPESHPLRARCEEWIRSVFEPVGVTNIETRYERDLDTVRSKTDELMRFDGMYVGGGNTYRLLYVLRSRRLDRPIADFGRAGGPIYGGSAGAIVLGQDVGVAELAGDPDDFGDPDQTGLGLTDCDVLPHYISAQDEAITARVSRTDRAVLAIPERGGWVIEGGRQFDGGREPVHLFEPRQRLAFPG
jgi:dipeptidase E